jgi:hypothetical protein
MTLFANEKNMSILVEVRCAVGIQDEGWYKRTRISQMKLSTVSFSSHS